MAENWLEIANKMAEAARAQLAADRRRLREILAKRERKQAPAQSSHSTPACDRSTAKAEEFELESPSPTLDEEDEETLAAIDEGLRDARNGRTVSAEEARKQLPA